MWQEYDGTLRFLHETGKRQRPDNFKNRTHLDVPVDQTKGVGECPDKLRNSCPAPVLPQSENKRRRRKGCGQRSDGSDSNRGEIPPRHDDVLWGPGGSRRDLFGKVIGMCRCPRRFVDGMVRSKPRMVTMSTCLQAVAALERLRVYGRDFTLANVDDDPLSPDDRLRTDLR